MTSMPNLLGFQLVTMSNVAAHRNAVTIGLDKRQVTLIPKS